MMQLVQGWFKNNGVDALPGAPNTSELHKTLRYNVPYATTRPIVGVGGRVTRSTAGGGDTALRNERAGQIVEATPKSSKRELSWGPPLREILCYGQYILNPRQNC